MKTGFTRCILYLLVICLCGCAKEEDFPKGGSYPFMKIQEANADSTGIHVTARVSVPSTAKVQEFGFAYSLSSSQPQQEQRTKATMADNRLSAALVSGLAKGRNYSIRAYALVAGKTVYSSPVLVTSLLSSQPLITGFSPTEGNAYTKVTITGSSFTNKEYDLDVYIGPARAIVKAADYEKLVIQVPDGKHFGSYPIRVILNDVEGKSDNLFKIWGPELLRMSKYACVPGDTATLFGNHLSGGGRWGPYVQLNGLSFKVLSSSPTKVKLEVPYGSPGEFDTPYPVTLINGEKTATSSFTFTIQSNFSQAGPLNKLIHTGYMPAFEANGVGYFFDYNRVISYTTATGRWLEESSFPGVPRSYPIWQRVGDKAYLIGGMDGNRYYGDVWEYDFRAGTWQKKTSPNFSVKQAASFVLDGKIYFAGGQNSRDSYVLWQYDPATQQFTALNKAPNYVRYGGAFVREGKAYILANSSVMMYDQTTDTWETHSSLRDRDGQTFTIGGSEAYLLTNGNTELFHYKPDTNTWEKVAFYPGCKSSYFYGTSFSGFATADALYVGAFRANTANGCYSSFYTYKP